MTIAKASAGAAFAIAVQLGSPAALAATPSDGSITYDTRTGCEYLYASSCKGEKQRLTLRLNGNTSDTIWSLEKFREEASNTFLNKQYSFFGNRAEAHAIADWKLALNGVKLSREKQYYWGENTGFRLGAYVGQIEGEAGIRAEAAASTRPFTVAIPALSIPAISTPTITTPALTIPSIPVIGVTGRNIPPYTVPAQNFPGYSFPGGSLTIPGYSVAAGHNHSSNGQSFYGGLTQAMGYDFVLNKSSHVLLGQFAHVGATRMNYGGSLGFLYASQPVTARHTLAVDPCRGQAYAPAQSGFTLSATVCLDKVVQDRLYDEEVKFAQRTAGRANAKLEEIAGRVQDATGYNPALPSVTGQQVMDFLGIESPYGRPHTTLNLTAASRFNNATLSLWHSIPLDGRGSKNQRTGLALRYDF